MQGGGDGGHHHQFSPRIRIIAPGETGLTPCLKEGGEASGLGLGNLQRTSPVAKLWSSTVRTTAQAAGLRSGQKELAAACRGPYGESLILPQGMHCQIVGES